MFNKVAFSNYYLRKRRDLREDGKTSIDTLIKLRRKLKLIRLLIYYKNNSSSIGLNFIFKVQKMQI